MSSDADPARLTAGLGSRWATAETSFKYHASCRHTHPSADALLLLMREHRLKPDDIAAVTAQVHQGAIDVLGRVVVPGTVHQAKFSMGTVLALVAEHGYAGLDEFDRHFLAPRIAALRDKVTMQLDTEVDTAYPQRWIGKVIVRTLRRAHAAGACRRAQGRPGQFPQPPRARGQGAPSCRLRRRGNAGRNGRADRPHLGRG